MERVCELVVFLPWHMYVLCDALALQCHAHDVGLVRALQALFWRILAWFLILEGASAGQWQAAMTKRESLEPGPSQILTMTMTP